MELYLRCETPQGKHDLVVGIEDSHTVGELATAVARTVGLSGPTDAGLAVRRTNLKIAPELTLADIDLISGDEISFVDPSVTSIRGRVSETPVGPAVTADVVSGPDTGLSQTVSVGQFKVGRHRNADLVVTDPSVSRFHTDVHLDPDGLVTVCPNPNAVNGVTVNDALIDGPTTVRPSDLVGLGGTHLAFRPYQRHGNERTDRLGQIEFQRTPYRPPQVRELKLDAIGPIPARPEPRPFRLLAATAPIFMGVALFAIMRQPTFLLFTLMAPMMMAGNFFEDKKSGRRSFADQLDEFNDMLDRRRDELEQLRAHERVIRHRAAPDLAELIRRAELRTTDLWARGRDAPDVLTIRLGIGDDNVNFDYQLDRGGDDDLRATASALLDGVEVLNSVPRTVSLLQHPVIGVHGEAELVDGVVASILVQTATLHSPEDVALAVAISAQRPFSWTKWLPHLRSVTSPLAEQHLVQARADVDALVCRLIELAEQRIAARDPNATGPVWPVLLVVLDSELQPDPAQVSRLLDLAPGAGISVVWMAPTAAQVTRQASRILSVSRGDGDAMIGKLWATNPHLETVVVEIEHVRADIAERAAMALAPVRDASTASLSTAIPRVAPLLDVLGVGSATPQWVIDQWRRHAPQYGLDAPIGMGATGPITIDLVENGPHTLIGGTSGAGKSELLQSMVAALAARHSPQRLNFLFIDYKGGASSQVFHALPHTVGYVTNLSADLSLRALTSLRAELNRRMAVMEGKAKDLAEMLEQYGDAAPASLVIIVDEFATLVKEVPEFVDGIIDIAQRGRSLGIHLVLATQRPSGSVNENILANTNLRMSLRMLDRAESNSVIDAPDAATIPVPLRGRGYIRLGPRQLVEFQSAFAGAPLSGGAQRRPVLAAQFNSPHDSPRTTKKPAGGVATPNADETIATHLSSLIEATIAASELEQIPPPLMPWRDVLPNQISFEQLATISPKRHALARQHPGRYVPYGLLDAPEQQAQYLALVDLEQGGGWLVFGSGGSGKTSLLRTVATSVGLAGRDHAAGAQLAAFDFGSRGLQSLTEMSHVIDVAAGDDLEAVTRLLIVLGEQLEWRQGLLAAAGAENLTAYQRDRAPLPRLLVLFDNFGAFNDTLLNGGLGGGTSRGGFGAMHEELSEQVTRLIVEGRQVGIHCIIAASRRQDVPARIHATVSNRLILRHADRSAYSDHGVLHSRGQDLDLNPGRGLIDAKTMVQVALVSDDDSARAQAQAIADLADRVGSKAAPVIQSSRLPERLECDRVENTTGLALQFGIVDISGRPAIFDLEWSNAVVAGPPRSGRSAAVAALAESATRHGLDVSVIGPVSSPLATLDLQCCGFGDRDAAVVLERLANPQADSTGPRVLIVDDFDRFDDPTIENHFNAIRANESLRIVAAIEVGALSGYSSSSLLMSLRKSRRLLMLAPDDPTDFMAATGVKMRIRPGLRMIPGRGISVIDRQPSTVQVFAPNW